MFHYWKNWCLSLTFGFFFWSSCEIIWFAICKEIWTHVHFWWLYDGCLCASSPNVTPFICLQILYLLKHHLEVDRPCAFCSLICMNFQWLSFINRGTKYEQLLVFSLSTLEIANSWLGWSGKENWEWGISWANWVLNIWRQIFMEEENIGIHFWVHSDQGWTF